MMAVTVLIPSLLRALTGEEKNVQASGGTVLELIQHLEAKYPGLQQRLMQGEVLHRFMNVYVNDADIRFEGELNALVRDGDVVTILPAVAGGSACGVPCR
jgi:molybdopterin synthase sulfur carrier subunit